MPFLQLLIVPILNPDHRVTTLSVFGKLSKVGARKRFIYTVSHRVGGDVCALGNAFLVTVGVVFFSLLLLLLLLLPFIVIIINWYTLPQYI